LSANANIEQTLRHFELDLLQETGYGVELDLDSRSGEVIVDNQRYRFAAGVGMLADAGGEVDGVTLRLLATHSPLAGYNLAEAKVLLRKMLDAHLQGRPLKSREVLGKIIKYL
jgi:DNA repair protein RecO (recombination protein O)